jgi:hypothetical protein
LLFDGTALIDDHNVIPPLINIDDLEPVLPPENVDDAELRPP